VGLPEMECQTDRAENLIAEFTRIAVRLTQGTSAIIAPLSGWLAAKGSNRILHVANFHNLASDWHVFLAYASR